MPYRWSARLIQPSIPARSASSKRQHASLSTLKARSCSGCGKDENSRAILQDLFTALKNAAKAAGVKLS